MTRYLDITRYLWGSASLYFLERGSIWDGFNLERGKYDLCGTNYFELQEVGPTPHLFSVILSPSLCSLSVYA